MLRGDGGGGSVNAKGKVTKRVTVRGIRPWCPPQKQMQMHGFELLVVDERLEQRRRHRYVPGTSIATAVASNAALLRVDSAGAGKYQSIFLATTSEEEMQKWVRAVEAALTDEQRRGLALGGGGGSTRAGRMGIQAEVDWGRP